MKTVDIAKEKRYAEWRNRLYALFETLNIIAEIERHGGTRLTPKCRYNPKEYCGPCPWFLNCPDGDIPCDAKNDGFLVWPTLHRELINGDSRPKHYWCRKCRRSGDILSLLETYCGYTKREACAILEINPWDENGAPIDVSLIKKQIVRGRSGPSEDQIKVIEALTCIYPSAQRMLMHPRALAYLAGRSIPFEVAQASGLGYIPDVSEGVAIEAGYDQWCDKIIFPAESPHGVKGFRGRTLAFWESGMDENEHRELLTSRDPICAPWLATYEDGYFNWSAMRRLSCPVFVEGPFDVLACQSVGIQALPIGTSRLPSPLHAGQVILALDRDESGCAATKRFVSSLRSLGIGYRVCEPPLGAKDWSEAYRLFGAEGLSVLHETLHTLQFCVDCDLGSFSSKNPFQERDGHTYCDLCYPVTEPLTEALCGICLDLGKDTLALYEDDGDMYCVEHRPHRADAYDQSQSEPIADNDLPACQEEIPAPTKTSSPVSLPSLPRKMCPCVTLGWNAKGGQIKQACKSNVTDNGFCETHGLAHVFLEIGAQLGYPEVKIPFKWKQETLHRTISAGLASWQEHACIVHSDRADSLKGNIEYLSRQVRLGGTSASTEVQ